ncbi:helix-turn-helix domain-containing protein [Allofournierella massiliensis]|uniref:Helix-turn-helix transcriptional regulator n=1 Tax=Allofournierella massiliensis TaxID=1650663 RepID=A0ABT7US66_9FIRM|nr:helix-turn-helix transcriptional regulator [Fournierella massiliensis]MDM8201737.1 helix-turn-helix transcriptional regulator [Fournierella massiliensis]
MEDIAAIVGERIKELRNKKAWTQEQLAEYADLHVSYIIALEKGRKNASVNVIYRIANAFDISLMDFFDMDEKNHGRDSQDMEKDQKEKNIERLIREYTKRIMSEMDSSEI